MTFEDPNEASMEERKRILEERREHLQEAIEKAKEIRARREIAVTEFEEVSTLIDGLHTKVRELVEEDKRLSTQMPETEDQWEEWTARHSRIIEIYSRLDDLYKDFSVVEKQISQIEEEFQLLMAQTNI